MLYKNITQAIFIDRPNRFTANVRLQNGTVETVHVKTTGRCGELLLKGHKVILERSSNPSRKTKYSIIAAYKDKMLVNIDSTAPNKVVREALTANKIDELQDLSTIKMEKTFSRSRFDIYFERARDYKGFMEIKGVTLEKASVSLFPDAPTQRGAKHLKDLIKAVECGYVSVMFFLVMMENVRIFKPNTIMDKAFSTMLKRAREKGVSILAYNCHVREGSLSLAGKVKVIL